jgi:hypothetical protein
VFTNKHVVIALIVAPILSVLAWFAVSSWIGEKPQAAQMGNSYPLLAQSNCRWPSGQCDMENEDFSLSLRLDASARLTLESSHVLDGIVLAVSAGPADSRPRAMSAIDEAGRHWVLQLDSIPGPEDRIQLVANAGGRQFFGDASTVFSGEDKQAAPGRTR